MVSDEKRTGTCEACGKSPRVRRQLDSGQWVCHTCLNTVRAPKEKPDPSALATDKQLAYAYRLGIDIPTGICRQDISKLITLRKNGFIITHDLVMEDVEDLVYLQKDVMFYVMDLWEQLTGKRPKQVGIPWKDQQRFAASVVRKYRVIAERCAKALRWCDDVSRERVLEYAEEHDDWEADQRQFRPGLPQDDTFWFVAAEARHCWKAYLPRRSWLSWLFRR